MYALFSKFVLLALCSFIGKEEWIGQVLTSEVKQSWENTAVNNWMCE